MLDGDVLLSVYQQSTQMVHSDIFYWLSITTRKKWLDREWVIYYYSYLIELFSSTFSSCQLWSWVRDGTRSLLRAHSHSPPIHSSSNVSHLPVPYFVGQPTLYLIACLEEGIWILSQKLFCNRKRCPLIKVWSTLLSLEALPGLWRASPWQPW